jgi:hypothetical protein
LRTTSWSSTMRIDSTPPGDASCSQTFAGIVAGLEDRYWDDVPHALAHEASVGVAPHA